MHNPLADARVYGAHAENRTYTAPNGKTYKFGAEDVLIGTLAALTPQEVCSVLAEYLQEAPHQGYEGFSRQDVSSIRKFFNDLAVCAVVMCTPDAHVHAYHMHKQAQGVPYLQR